MNVPLFLRQQSNNQRPSGPGALCIVIATALSMKPPSFQAPLTLFGRRSWRLKERGCLAGKSNIPGPREIEKARMERSNWAGRERWVGPVLSFGAFPVVPVKVAGEQSQWVLRAERVLGKA